jgi:hypothetical protein
MLYKQKALAVLSGLLALSRFSLVRFGISKMDYTLSIKKE